MGHDGDLMAARHTVDEMRDLIGADSLAFLSLEGMMRAIEPENEGSEQGYCNVLHGALPDAGRRSAAQAQLRRRCRDAHRRRRFRALFVPHTPLGGIRLGTGDDFRPEPARRGSPGAL